MQRIISDDLKRILGWMFTDDVLLDLAGYVQAYSTRASLARSWTEFLHEQPLILAPVSQLLPFAPNDDASSPERFAQIMAGHAPLLR